MMPDDDNVLETSESIASEFGFCDEPEPLAKLRFVPKFF
jgi:hypothetical protein